MGTHAQNQMSGMFLAAALWALWPASPSAHAATSHKGSIAFQAEEVKAHAAALLPLLQTSAACLHSQLSRHHSFYRAHGFSPFYGDRSQFGRLSHAAKKNHLRRMGVNPRLLDQMEPISCVGLLLKCLGQGFQATKQEEVWKRIRAFTLLNEADGTALQFALQKLGWKLYYWNPDVRKNAVWDRQEKHKDPSNRNRFWGYHEYNWFLASKKTQYGFLKIDDARLFVNFGERVPAQLKNVPFWVGTAHGGYHVFPGTGSKVVEAHSTRRITDTKTIQADTFNPLQGMAPSDGLYLSGLIALPPLPL